MINRLEWIGKQMEDLGRILAGAGAGQALHDALDEVLGELVEVEDKLLQRQFHASDPKSYREQMMLFSKLLWFSSDIRNTEDYGPTSQQLEVYEMAGSGPGRV